jgi:hypothetical protein
VATVSHPTDQQVSQAIKLGIAASQKGDYASAVKVFRAVYDNPAIQAPPDGMSWYGLAIALQENQISRAVQLCRDAISAQFFDERHYENLVRIHLHKGNRLRAEQALADGLKNVPTGSRLLALQDELGLTLTPTKQVPLPAKTRAFDMMSMSSAKFAIIGILVFALAFGITFWVLYRQAYGP